MLIMRIESQRKAVDDLAALVYSPNRHQLVGSVVHVLAPGSGTLVRLTELATRLTDAIASLYWQQWYLAQNDLMEAERQASTTYQKALDERVDRAFRAV